MYKKTLGVFSLLICELFFNRIYSQNLDSISNEIKNKTYYEYYYAFTEATKQYLLGNYIQAENLYKACLTYKPHNSAINYQLALIYLKNNKVKEATSYALKACNDDKNNKWYLSNLAQIYQISGKIDSAIIVYKELIDKEPENIDYKNVVAYLLQSNQRYKEALNYYDQIETQTGPTRGVIFEKYRIYLLLNDKANALRELQIAKSFTDDVIAIYGLMAEFYYSENEIDSAVYYYKKAISNYEDYPEIAFSYTNFLNELGKVDSARGFIISVLKNNNITKEVKENFIMNLIQDDSKLKQFNNLADTIAEVFKNKYVNDSDAYSIFAAIEFKIENYEKSASALKIMINKDSDNYMIWEQLLYAESIMNESDSVIFYGRRTIEKFSDIPVPYLMVGSAYLQEKKNENALDILNSGIGLVGNNNMPLKLQFFSLLGEVNNNLRNYKKSDEYFESALKIDPENLLIRNNYAYYLSLRNENLSYAEKLSKLTIEKEPKNYSYLDTYAWICFKHGKIGRAKKYIEEALKLGGNKSADILDHYGDILYQRRQYKDAINYWKEAIKFDDDLSKKNLFKIDSAQRELKN